MGNRAVITTESKELGIYLHWNGGRDSVEGFLKYCELRGFRAPSDDNYGWACLAHVITNFFGDGMSCGIDLYDRLDTDNWDNGVYVIKGWEIVDRLFMHGDEQQEYPLDEMLRSIDRKMPEDERLGDYLDSIEVPTDSLHPGDSVWFWGWEKPQLMRIQGIGRGLKVNGRDVLGVPYVNRFGDNESAEGNINNYIFSNTVRVPR